MEDLDEFGPQDRSALPDPRADVSDDFVYPPPVPAAQAHGVVPAIGLGEEETQLRAGTAGKRGHVRCLAQYIVDPCEERHRLVRRGSRGRPVVQDERAFVHLRHEASLEVPVGDPRQRNEGGRGDERDVRVAKRGAERPPVPER